MKRPNRVSSNRTRFDRSSNRTEPCLHHQLSFPAPRLENFVSPSPLEFRANKGNGLVAQKGTSVLTPAGMKRGVRR